jgi:hypothetical protein
MDAFYLAETEELLYRNTLFFFFFTKEKQMVREPDAFKVDLAIEPNK